MLAFTSSFYTFSGLLAFGALVAAMNRWFTPAGLLLTVAGAGGLGVFWERWSRMAGDDVHIAALLSGVRPTAGQAELLATHLPMLAAGVTAMALALALASLAVACGGDKGSAQSSKNGFNPPAPTPSTPNPADQIRPLDDAIAKATNEFIAQTGDPAIAAHVKSLMYVETTAAKAAALLRQSVAPPLAGHVAWLFVEHGIFRHVGFKNATPGPVKNTLWVLMIQGDTWPLSSAGAETDQAVDLTSLGTPVEIPPGRIPAVDAIRGPMALTLGAPSLVGGAVQVPVVATNPYKATLVPYRALNVHVRWDPAAFSYAGVNSTGSVLPAPTCVRAVSHDADGGGVVLGCGAVGGSTAATGLLATVLLTPKAGARCSRVHLVTYGGADWGDARAGTYAVNAFTGQPLPAEYGDANVNSSGVRAEREAARTRGACSGTSVRRCCCGRCAGRRGPARRGLRQPAAARGGATAAHRHARRPAHAVPAGACPYRR